MAVEVIDLCSSPEPDESPNHAAEGALAVFLPRKDKAKSKLANGNHVSPTHTSGHDVALESALQVQTPSNPPPPITPGDYKVDPSVYNIAQANGAIEQGQEQDRLRKSVSAGEQRQANELVGLVEELSDRQNSNENSQKGFMQEHRQQGQNTIGRQSIVRSTNVVDLTDDEDPAEHDPYDLVSRRVACETGRSFRVDKSKRYPQEKERSPDRNNTGERYLMTKQAQSDMISRPVSSERLLESFLPEQRVNGSHTELARVNGDRLQAPAVALLSGAGLEIVRAYDRPSPRQAPREVGNSSKRLASSPADDAQMDRAKRHRTDKDSKAFKAKLVDVTNPAAERVSYSDEPDVNDRASTSPRTSFATATSTGQRDTPPSSQTNRGASNRYSAAEDALILQLIDGNGLDWEVISKHFQARTPGALMVHYYNKLRHAKAAGKRPANESRRSAVAAPVLPRNDSSDVASGRGQRLRKSVVSDVDGFVSWTSLKRTGIDEVATSRRDAVRVSRDHSPEPSGQPLLRQDTSFPSSMSQILRHRELGTSGRRAWRASPMAIRDDIKNHVYSKYALRQQYHGTSGDVVSLAWAPDGDRFAAGSIAISDDRSMQYNMQRNLVVGGRQQRKLRELLEHHVPRPLIEESDNVNGLHAMRASQDARLFKTVTATAFAPLSSKKLYTTGEDKMLRRYCVGEDLRVKCRYEISHPARVDLLAVSSPHGIVATACHTEADSIHLYRCHERAYETGTVFSPVRSDLQSSAPIYPSTLKWGIAYQHCALLLAGFGGDEEKEYAGETCLWNVDAGTAIPIRSATRNVFDVAWNPNPSAASVAFAVASNATGLPVGRRTRSAIQCFAPNQQEARRVLTWECPAADINDVLFCPYDSNLIAAGATNGTVYIWDQRSAARDQKPLHILHHGASENIIAHDRDAETADTGVRFLSWGATKTRLYSGSHDGIVKVWNPYRSPNNAHVDDIAPPRHEKSAVMSGAFNQDHRELLVGTENGRINLFSVEGGAVYKPETFKLETAPAPKEEEHDGFAAARSMVESGKIEIRPCGAMPFRQAVQGPNYDGPFLAPSTDESSRAEERYNQALIAQSDAYSRKAQSDLYDDGDDEEEDADVAKADNGVQAAQQALNDLQERLNHFSIAQPKAKEFQQSLLMAEHDRTELLSHFSDPVERCALKCTVLSNSDEGEDCGRSELRIPDALRSIEQNAAWSKTGDDSANDSCASCFPLKALCRNVKRSLCASCKLKKAGLTVSCSTCSAPARLQTDTTKETLCERCSFTCFRCNGPVTTDDDMTFVNCSSCLLSWEIGVLGYDLVTAPDRRQSKAVTKENQDDLEAYDDFGALEREHYASLWQDTADGDDDTMWY